MSGKSSDRQNQAVAILAIATAAIGFGLFGADLELQFPSARDLRLEIEFVAKFIGIIITSVAYLLVLLTTGIILERDDRVTGSELVKGPVAWMVFEVLGLGWIFVGNLLSV